jgi:hypothetical protein
MNQIILTTSVVGWAALAGARPCRFDGQARTKLDQQIQAHIPLVFAECQQGDGKSILILPLRTNVKSPVLAPYSNGLPAVDLRDNGLLIQYVKGSCAPSSAIVEFSGTGKLQDFQLGLSSGGAGTYALSKALASELLRSDFHLMWNSSVKNLVESAPSKTCQTRMDRLWREPFMAEKTK